MDFLFAGKQEPNYLCDSFAFCRIKKVHLKNLQNFMTELKCLTTQEVARLCRVSDATVKRWENAGLLQSERTSGGHRRFRAEEVARFQCEQGLGLKHFHGDESLTRAVKRRPIKKNHSDSSFFNSLEGGCEESAANFLINAYMNGKPLTEIFDELICPALRKIGELWFNGEISVTQEHLATRVATNAIYKLRNTLPVKNVNGKLAICCAFESDFHDIPTHLAQITLENEGWDVMNFGANTPLYCLKDEVLQHSPAIICIAATIMNDMERLSRDYEKFFSQIEKYKIPVLLGGRAFEDECVRRRFPADFYARNFSEFAEFTQNIAEIN